MQKNFIKQGRKTLAFMLVVILCTAQMKPVEAKENESTNLTILVEGMVHDGILKESQISSVAVVEANMNGNGVARSATEKLEVIKIVSEDENTCTEMYVVPFLMGDDGLTTLSLSGTATQKNLDYNDVIYIDVKEGIAW